MRKWINFFLTYRRERRDSPSRLGTVEGHASTLGTDIVERCGFEHYKMCHIIFFLSLSLFLRAVVVDWTGMEWD